MAALTAFLKHVQPEVPVCPQPIVLEAVLRACIEFCERTRLFDETVSVTTVAGTSEYSLGVASGTVAHEIIYVRKTSDDSDLGSSKREQFDANITFNDSGEPLAYYLTAAGKLKVGPVPAAGDEATYSVKVVIKPSTSATTVQDALADHWALVIAAGAKSFLYAQKNTAWYAPDEAAIKGAFFTSGINRAKAELNLGRSGTPTQVAMRPFA